MNGTARRSCSPASHPLSAHRQLPPSQFHQFHIHPHLSTPLPYHLPLLPPQPLLLSLQLFQLLLLVPLSARLPLLDLPRHIRHLRQRQPFTCQFRLNHLPSPHSGLAVDLVPAAVNDVHVWERGEGWRLLEAVGEFGGWWGDDFRSQSVDEDGEGLVEAGLEEWVGDQVAGELGEAFEDGQGLLPLGEG